MLRFDESYAGKTVLVTGHTGFKGAWLSTWLLELGADVVGFSLPEPVSEPNMFDVCGLADRMTDRRGDIRDRAAVAALVAEFDPDVIFHMAAQPIVLTGIAEPVETFEVNAQGTVHVLEAVREVAADGPAKRRAFVSITTDKVYEDQNWPWGYRETDRLGGKDPYSASKAMAELSIHAYRRTYFRPEDLADHGVALSSVRAGNVIGGGDLAPHRLVPDCIRALQAGQPIEVRNPASVRPWQHVLVPLSGYLELGRRLLGDDAGEFCEAWNFGPADEAGITVGQVADQLIEIWGSGSVTAGEPDTGGFETFLLRLAFDKAAAKLRWKPGYDWIEALQETAAWFRALDDDADMYATTVDHIDQFG